MATDMSMLARNIAPSIESRRFQKALMSAAEEAEGCGILDRLRIFGRHISLATKAFNGGAIAQLASHQSDVVRQWVVYAANDPRRECSLSERLELTLRSAADRHMSVRECAWMAFRPHFANGIVEGLRLLEPITLRPDPTQRRFAIEVTRPRSVWGQHISVLKETPQVALELLSNVRQDESRYVRLAVGNWLNDASKTKPDWVRQVCADWLERSGCKHTAMIATRGLRTLTRQLEPSQRTSAAEQLHAPRS
jgi:3-methyladenine DNA glycosylase AlkC